MLIYAGIDEAGYGPMFGPLVIGRSIIAIDRITAQNTAADRHSTRDARDAGRHNSADPDAHPDDKPANIAPDFWKLLSKAVCRELNDKRGRIAVNDSKKVKTAAAGIRHLELGVLAFACQRENIAPCATLCDWLDSMGERGHQSLSHLPWYHPCDERPWCNLPAVTTAGEVAIARNMLAAAARACHVRVLDMGAAVVFEDRFNRMVSVTRSKASASFTFVASHLAHIWEHHGEHGPIVAVDRQSGRTRYRELLAQCFPSAQITVLDETNTISAYRLRENGNGRGNTGDPDRTTPGSAARTTPGGGGGGSRSMTVQFEVNGDGLHLPVALASMISKYTREMLMARFNAWFTSKVPSIAPTAGYASDAKRFWTQIEPMLEPLGIRRDLLQRVS